MNKYYIDYNDAVEIVPGQDYYLYRVVANKDFYNRDGKLVKKGAKGGYIHDCENLNMEDDSWIADNAKVDKGVVVTNNSYVSGNSILQGNVLISNSGIYDDCEVTSYEWDKITGERKNKEDYSIRILHSSLNDDVRIFGKDITVEESVLLEAWYIRSYITIKDSVLKGNSILDTCYDYITGTYKPLKIVKNDYLDMVVDGSTILIFKNDIDNQYYVSCLYETLEAETFIEEMNTTFRLFNTTTNRLDNIMKAAFAYFDIN